MNIVHDTFGVSLIGEYHSRKNMPNQDHWDYMRHRNCSAVVVSDGLGSKKYSDVGSRMACKAVMVVAKDYCDNGRSLFGGNILQDIHAKWLKLLEGYQISDCGATCLFAIRRRNQIIVGQLGDGVVVVVCRDSSKSFTLADPKDNSFLNMTDCLDAVFNESRWRTKFFDADDCRAVVLYTDGISEDIDPDMHIDFANGFYLGYRYYRPKQRERKILGMLKNWHDSGSTDDKTIACLPIKRIRG